MHPDQSADAGGRSSAPTHGSEAFACPHCGAFAQQTWLVLAGFPKGGADRENVATDLEAAVCMACHRRSLWKGPDPAKFGGDPWDSPRMIYPVATRTGPDPHLDMPDPVRALYEEARAVAGSSPRSGAALLRLALEGLLAELYPASRLNESIAAAVRGGLTPPVQQAMDILRFAGNEAVHELRQEDDAATTEAYFELLNLVVDQLIGQPRRIADMYDALPPEKREQVERRDGDASG
jgi:hypothetical protein